MLKDKDKDKFVFNDLTKEKQLPTIVKSQQSCQQSSSNYVVFTSRTSCSNFYRIILQKAKKMVDASKSEHSSLSDELRASLQELSLFKKNWDGYGASSFKKEVINNAFQLLRLIFSKNISLFGKINDIFIEPETNGVISFNIEYKDEILKSTNISVGRNKISSYSKYSKHSNSGLMFDLEYNDLDFLVSKLNDAVMGIYSYKYVNGFID